MQIHRPTLRLLKERTVHIMPGEDLYRELCQPTQMPQQIKQLVANHQKMHLQTTIMRRIKVNQNRGRDQGQGRLFLDPKRIDIDRFQGEFLK